MPRPSLNKHITYLDLTTQTKTRVYIAAPCPRCGATVDGIRYDDTLREAITSYHTTYYPKPAIILEPCAHTVNRMDMIRDKLFGSTSIRFVVDTPLDEDYEKCPICQVPSVGPCPTHLIIASPLDSTHLGY